MDNDTEAGFIQGAYRDTYPSNFETKQPVTHSRMLCFKEPPRILAPILSGYSEVHVRKVPLWSKGRSENGIHPLAQYKPHTYFGT